MLLAATVVIFVVAYLYQLYHKRHNKALWSVPVLGHWLSIGRFPYVTFSELAKSLPDVFTLNVGTRQVVVLNTEEAILTNLNKKEFSGRPEFPCWNLFREPGRYST